MNQKHREDVLMRIEHLQRENGGPLSGTASVIVEVGGTSDSGQVEHESLYLHKVNDRVLNALQEKGYKIDLEDGVAEVTVPEGFEDTEDNQ